MILRADDNTQSLTSFFSFFHFFSSFGKKKKKLAHRYFQKQEPTFFKYINLQIFIFMICFISFSNLILAFKSIITFNFFLGSQIIFYRIFSHPLSSIPGPFLASLTQFWILREAYLGRTRFTMHELGIKYGDWVRIGQSILLLQLTPQTVYGIIISPAYHQIGFLCT